MIRPALAIVAAWLAIDLLAGAAVWRYVTLPMVAALKAALHGSP